MRRLACLAAVALAVSTSAGCGKLQGFGGPAPPLASFTLTLSGDITPFRPAGDTGPPALRVALVWGAPWITEPFCVLSAESLAVLPAESVAVEAVKIAGCRDPFGFVPLEVGPSVPLESVGPTTLTLDALPPTDVLVGDVSARVSYGSFVVFDDRDGDGTLSLGTPHNTASGRGDRRGGGNTGPDPADRIYGASFVTMTKLDRRVAYREGGEPPSTFYPRAMCPAPDPGFSVVGAGGFAASDPLAVALMGQTPPEDPATCFASAPGATTTDIPAMTPTDVEEVGCDERTQDGSIRYREPPADAPDFTDRLTVCAHLPTFDTNDKPSDLIQLVVTGRAADQCKGLTHYTLKGCRENVTCPVPDWDFTATPPAWWPCP